MIEFKAGRSDGDPGDEPVIAGYVYLSIEVPEGEEVSMFSGWVKPPVRALVKAAPDLLEALKQSNRVLSSLPVTGDIVLAVCANDAAIAKATQS